MVGTLSRPYPCDETFAGVAYFIGEKYSAASSWKPNIILHTSNIVAGDEMALVLSGYGIQAEKKYMGAANRLEMEV